MQNPKQDMIQDDMQFQILPELTEQEAAKMEQEHIDGLNKFYGDTKRYAIQSWYDELKQFTFSSYHFPLTNIEAYLLNLIYQEKEEQLVWPEIQSTRLSLIDKVDTFIKQHFPNGCFFKLSTRSPKDYSWRYQNQETHQSDIQNLVKRLSEPKRQFNKDMLNSIYRYFLEESKTKIKILNGKEFIKVFSSSQRIQIDINDLMYINNKVAGAINNKDFSRANEVLLNVWGRQWVDCSWMQQFRCFYNDYKLNGISQYDQRCYFEELNGKKQLISQKILSFFQLIKPKLKNIELQSGVMDVIVKFNNEVVTVQLIQINVFNVNSRASLFSWQNDENIMKEGPLQFRYHTYPIQISKWELLKMMGMIERGIQKILNKVMEKLGYEKQWKQYV